MCLDSSQHVISILECLQSEGLIGMHNFYVLVKIRSNVSILPYRIISVLRP